MTTLKKNQIFALVLTTLLSLTVSPQTIFPQDLILKSGDIPPKLDFRLLNQPTNEKNPTWEDFKNQVVILDFWATWCAPCREVFPHLNRLVKEFEEKPVKLLSITYEPEYMIKPFLKKYKLDTQIGIDNDFKMFKSFKAWGIPMAVIVNKKRKIACVIAPSLLTNDLIEQILVGEIPEVEQHPGWPEPEGAEEYFRSLVKPKE